MKVKCLIIFLWPIIGLTQVSFRTEARILNKEEIYSAVPMAIIDINNDLLDDIVTLDNGNHLKVFYQTQNTSEFYMRDYGLVSSSGQFAIAAGDMDNDGWKEIFIGGLYDGIKVYKAFAGSTDFLQYRKTSTNFFTQNISLIDIDRDGLLDLYVNDDDDTPKVFLNVDGMDFIPIEPFDFPSSGEAASGNYGSVFTDFDDDGDIDLYISKCRLGVDNSLDPRRINQLWVNDGEGNYVELAEEYGLAVGEQSWVSDFADLDNDGDRDLVILNHTDGNYIFENENGVFTRKSQIEGWNQVYEGLQLIVRDFDNDGLKDIMTAGFKAKMFWNKGEFTFEEDEQFLLDRNPLSLAVGDLNNDGFWDLITTYAEGLTQENDYIKDDIWINNENNNHFLKLTLKGNVSNKDAIGTSAKLYGEWGVQDYEVRAGESYGITNSLSIIFGLGSAMSFDSLLVRWPNGNISKHLNIDIDSHHIIQENGCINQEAKLSSTSSEVLCKEEVAFLSGPTASSYEWSDGSTNPSLLVSHTGFYQLDFTDTLGCENATTSFYIKHIDQVERPIIRTFDPYELYCKGQGIVLATQYQDVSWNGETESSALYALAGDTILATLDICDTLRSEPFTVETLQIHIPIGGNDTIILGENAEFRVSGENVLWYETINSGEPISDGNTVIVENLEKDSTLFAAAVGFTSSYDTVAFDRSNEVLDFPPDHINGGLIFSVEKYVTTLESILCFTDIIAIRKIQIKDYWGNIIHEKEVLISPEDSLVQLNFQLAPSNYYLITTDESTNLANLGIRSPRLKRILLADSVFDLVSKKGNVVIQNSTGTPLNYYAFYNWKLSDYDLACESERVAVKVVVNQPSSIVDENLSKVSVSPNPFTDFLIVNGIRNQVKNLVVMDIAGRVLYDKRVEEVVNLSSLQSGVYFLKIDDQVFKVICNKGLR